MKHRAIKFRGLCKETNVWLYGYLHKVGTQYVIQQENQNWNPVQEHTIGQYIGNKDLKGTEVYEGDIVIPNSIDEKCIIRYDDHRACFTCIRESGTFWDVQNIQEVVGNIY